MATYQPPVDRLLSLGRPELSEHWTDYSTHGIGPEHVPELIRLLLDEEVASRDSATPDVYAQVHAWRALGQLKAEAAIEPLLDLLASQEGDDWNDWVTEEVPQVLGRIGRSALLPAAARLEQTRRLEHAPVYYAQTLAEIAKAHPDVRDEVVSRMTAFLEKAAENDPSVNGFLISDMMDLAGKDAWPVIEKAFATGNVDESIVGGPDYVKWHLGLGPQPPRAVRHAPPRTGGTTAKDRADQRKKQRKADKRRKKRGR